jgi:hypothetical protein
VSAQARRSARSAMRAPAQNRLCRLARAAQNEGDICVCMVGQIEKQIVSRAGHKRQRLPRWLEQAAGLAVNGGDLRDVFRAQEKIGVVKRLLREERQRLGRDFQNLAAFKRGGADAIFGEEAVGRFIGAEGQRVLINEGGRGHGENLA